MSHLSRSQWIALAVLALSSNACSGGGGSMATPGGSTPGASASPAPPSATPKPAASATATATATATASPTPAPEMSGNLIPGLYVNMGAMSSGIQIYSSSGSLTNSYAPAGTQAFNLDNAGNTVIAFTPSGANDAEIERVANGSNVQNGSYQRMDTDSLQLYGNAAGTIATDGTGDPLNLEDPDEDYEDVWYDGATGTPAASYVGGPGSGNSFDPGIIAVAPDDSLVGTFADETFDVYPRGQTTPSRTLSADANDEYLGSPLVATNGTVYVGEGPYSGGGFAVQVTPAQGSSYSIGVPSKPVGLDLDGQGNLYVLTDGSQSASSLSVFAPNATTANRTVSSGLTSGAIGLLVTRAGVAYIEQVSQTGSGVPFGSTSTMPCDGQDTYTGCSEIVQFLPGATAATTFVPNYSGDSPTFEMGYIDGSGAKMLRTHVAGAMGAAARLRHRRR